MNKSPLQTSTFSKGDILLGEGVYPSTVYKVLQGSVRWLWRHPSSGLMTSVAIETEPVIPIGAYSLISGKALENCVVSSEKLTAEVYSNDDWIVNLTNLLPSSWPSLNTIELVALFDKSLSSVPYLDLSLVSISSEIQSRCQLLPPLLNVDSQYLKDII